MDKKKLVGTIIGVIAFAALIAGATYAWLSNGLGVNNGVYNFKSMNFLVNYVNGADISNDVPILASATSSTAKSLTITASLANDSAPGTITVYLNTSSVDSNLLNGAIKYSYCIDSCGASDFATNTRTLSASGQVAIISNHTLTTTPENFIVYFWLDGSEIGDDQVGKTYSGYISAVAEQTES